MGIGAKQILVGLLGLSVWGCGGGVKPLCPDETDGLLSFDRCYRVTTTSINGVQYFAAPGAKPVALDNLYHSSFHWNLVIGLEPETRERPCAEGVSAQFDQVPVVPKDTVRMSAVKHGAAVKLRGVWGTDSASCSAVAEPPDASAYLTLVKESRFDDDEKEGGGSRLEYRFGIAWEGRSVTGRLISIDRMDHPDYPDVPVD